jgi:hypothetical protein
MASEILGLFTTPEQYRAMQGQQTQNEALQYAALNPFQRADVSLYTGGKQLGQGTARLFGLEDPQLKKISMRQQMISGTNTMNNALPALDFTNPDMLRQASAFALQQNQDPEFAMFLAKKADEVALNQANITAKLRERPANVDKAIQVAQTRAELQDTIARLEADQVANPNNPDIARSLAIAKNTLAGLPLKTEGLVREQQIARDLALAAGPEDSDAYKTAYAKNLRDLTTKATQEKLGEFERVLNARFPDTPENADRRAQLMEQFLASEIQGKGKGRGNTDIKLTLPGQDKAGVKGVSEFRASVIDTVKPFRNTVTSADQAIQSINDSLKTGNFISFNAARTQLAKALGDGTLSRRDVEQAGGDPSILGGLADTASTMFTGTPTADTQRKIKSTLMAIRKVAREKGSSELAIQRQIAEQSGYDEKQMKTIFNFPEFEIKGKSAAPETSRTNETIPSAVADRITQPPAKGKTQTRTLKSGKTVTVETE